MTNPSKIYWFTEKELPYSSNSIRISTKINSVLFDQKSDFCRIQVFDTPFYRRMLVMDGIVQTTEIDEFIYHEMMVIAPSLYHGNIKRALVIGGGDGGSIRQAVRIKSLQKVTMVEIDQVVIEASKAHIPTVSGGAFSNKKVEVIVGDGKKYLEKSKEKFDLIVLDLTDPFPDSPAVNLFMEPFLHTVKKSLAAGGILAMQCGSLLFQPEEVSTITKRLRRIFSLVRSHNAVVPGYQLSSFGFLYACDGPLHEPVCQIMMQSLEICSF